MANMNSNRRNSRLSEDTHTTLNHEGAVVHKLNSLETLFSKVLGSFFGESTYYENRSAEDDFKETLKLIKEVSNEDIAYILKIAFLGRKYNMIQFPLAVLTACFNDDRFKGDCNLLNSYGKDIILRGRDVCDVLGNHFSAFPNTPVPAKMRKVLKSKLESFDSTQISKSLSKSKQVSMADCIKLLHPCEIKSRVPKGFYRDVIEDHVKFGGNQKQVQSELSKANNQNSESSMKDVKSSLKTSSLMAIVKNLVALDKQRVFEDKECLDLVVSRLTSEKEVKNSRLLPFRFYSAYKASIGIHPKISDALHIALNLSVDNLPEIEGYSAILIDNSGSMRSSISPKSDTSALDIANVLGAICLKKSVADVFVFANTCRKVHVSSVSSILDIVNELSRVRVGGGTYLNEALHEVRESAIERGGYDNLIVLTDNDCYDRVGVSYTPSLSRSSDERVNELIKNSYVKKFFLNNLLGNDFSIVNTDDFRKNLITGFSEKIVDVINTYSVIGKGASDIRNVIDSLVRKL